MKGVFLMTAMLVIALALPSGGSVASAQIESAGSSLSPVSAQEESVTTDLAAVTAADGFDGILFGFSGGGITREPATETLVQVSIAHTCVGSDELILEKVEIYGESGAPVRIFSSNRTLESIAGSYDRLKSLSERFESAPVEEIGPQAAILAQEIRSKSFSTQYFALDLSDLKRPLALGERVPITARATLVHHGEELVIERTLSVDYKPGLASTSREVQITTSLPALQDWKRGVQHVHTAHSDWDWSYLFPDEDHVGVDPPTVALQAQAAKNAGLSWIIVTDHEEMLSAQEWLEERDECAQAETDPDIGIQVMCGEEVGSAFPTSPIPVPIPVPPFIIWPRGHYLAYNIGSYISWDWNESTQDAIDEVNSSNDGGGFGFIAHPTEPPQFWWDWTVRGYVGLEIMNGPAASDSFINKWKQLLENPSARIFALGNSDAHWPEEVASGYVYCDTGAEVGHASVFSALEHGRSVVSNRPLIAFSIGNKRIGDTLTTSYDNAFLDIAWDAQDSEEAIQKIEVYSNEGLIKTKAYASGVATGTTTLMVNVTPQTLYVRLKGTFSNGEAYTNPIWVVYSNSGGGGCPFLQVWNGTDYVNEGLLDIHNAVAVDVTYEHTLMTVPVPVDGAYGFRLIEYPTTISDIDQVQLRAVLEDGTIEELPLQAAWHSEDGNVHNLLRKSDDRRAEEKGADHNGGVSQSIDLEFAALGPQAEAVGFIFTIEGYNPFYKT